MTKPGARRLRWQLACAAALLLAALCVLVVWLNLRGEEALVGSPPTQPASAAVIERGAYLARAGNCQGCHTATGGAPFAGGKGVETPFGRVFAPNITPDETTGIGRWSASEFWRAMHHGRSKDGRLLYPAFPYPSFTQVTREDADALYAFLRSVTPVAQANRPHALRFPYSTQAALAVWRALYFRPGAFVADAAQSAAWNRGKYLVQGLGHCAACHSSRDFLGGISLNTRFAGGLMPDSSWYAPSLSSSAEAGLQGGAPDEAVKLLRDGVSRHATVSGPMADVVFNSTQFLSEPDLRAMVQFLASIPVKALEAVATGRAGNDVMTKGEKLYAQHCAACHGAAGEGVPDIYPALAGNRAVTLGSTNNLVQVIRQGGFLPTTAGNPRPFGMPPYGQLLDDEEIAVVATYIRQSWGHAASALSPLDVLLIK